MKYVVWKAFWNYEKEERYLNEMSSKGLALISYSFGKYVFEDAPQGEYIYRIELLDHLVRHPESMKYIGFMEETGAEFVASQARWVYFRKRASDGMFNIYSDTESKIIHCKRILWMYGVIMYVNLLVGIINLIIGIFELNINMYPFNFYTAGISLTVGIIFMLFLVRPLIKKVYRLKMENNIHE